MKTKENFPKTLHEQIEKYDGYPKYFENEDIYNKFDEESIIDLEDMSKKKPSEINEDDPEWNEKDIDLEHPEEESDVSNTEINDEPEDIGNEGEDKNYFNIGGDNINDFKNDNQ